MIDTIKRAFRTWERYSALRSRALDSMLSEMPDWVEEPDMFDTIRGTPDRMKEIVCYSIDKELNRRMIAQKRKETRHDSRN